jgi:hypothetical protein
MSASVGKMTKNGAMWRSEELGAHEFIYEGGSFLSQGALGPH